MIVSALGLSDLVDSVFTGITGAFTSGINVLLGKIVSLLTWNPDTESVKPLINDFIELLTPLYVIAFITIGIYFLFLSQSPKGRANARSALLKLLISMVFVIAATSVYQFFLDLSELLVNFVLSLVNVNVTPLGAILLGAMAVTPIFSIVYAILLLGLLVLYSLRYLVLLIMAAVFPLTIFLFFFEPTKGVGRQLMRFTLALIFTPVVQAIALIFWITTMNNIGTASGLAGNFIVVAVGFAGLVLMIIAPLITLGLLKWIGGLVMFIGFRYMATRNMKMAMPLFLTGGLMMGEGAGAVPLAATFWFVGQLEHKSEHVAENLTRKPRLARGARQSRVRGEQGGTGGRQGGTRGRQGGTRGEQGGTRRVSGQSGSKGGSVRGLNEPTWIKKGPVGAQDLMKAGDELMSIGHRAKARGEKSIAQDRFKKAAQMYEKAIKVSKGTGAPKKTGKPRLADPTQTRQPKLSGAELADALGRLGDAYAELNRTTPKTVYSKSALKHYQEASAVYEKAGELNPKKQVEYSIKSNEYNKKAAEIRYRRG